MRPAAAAPPWQTETAMLIRTETTAGDAGLHFATSPDLPGLLVAERTPEAADAAIPQAIIDLCAAQGRDVRVERLDGGAFRLVE